MARQPISDIVVLLPGIMGSVLKKHGDIVWGFSASTVAQALISRAASVRDALWLHEDPPDAEMLDDGIVADELMPDLHLMPGFWKIDGYAAIASTLLSTFELVEGENFFRFPYDWRRDNRVAARRLARSSGEWLRHWRRKSPDARLILVAHSMGGLVARHFLEVLDGWRETRALVTFGTPYRGSLNALNSLANGVRQGPFGFFDLTDLTRSFTSTYQLLPIYPCYDAGDGLLIRVAEAEAIPHVEPERARAALLFHREIEDRATEHAQDAAYVAERYQIHPIVGLQQRTFQSARLNGVRLEMLREHEGRDLSGDGTVPRVSASPIEGSFGSGHVFAATKHGSLQNAATVLTQLEGILTGFSFDLGAFRKGPAPVRLTLDVEDLYWTTEPLDVRAKPTAADVRLTATIIDTRTRTVAAAQLLYEDADGWHAARFAPLPDGAYSIQVAGDGVETAADAFIVAHG